MYCSEGSILLTECSLVPEREAEYTEQASWFDWWWQGPGTATEAFIAET